MSEHVQLHEMEMYEHIYYLKLNECINLSRCSLFLYTIYYLWTLQHGNGSKCPFCLVASDGI